jgi:Spy/CpxP family protein refolding chaperone
VRLAFALALLLLPLSGGAQAPEAPYAGLEQRRIKALGQDEVDALLSGGGMRMALPAELNHYPGPRHVLEFASQLGLSPEQRSATEAVHDRMLREAVRLGRAVVDAEAALDRAFAEGTIDEPRLAALTDEIGRLRGRLRAVHLAAHLEMKRILSPEQVRRYDALRGYAGDAAAPAPGAGGRGGHGGRGAAGGHGGGH